MVNIQSPTAEIRRAKKKKEEEERNRMKIYMVSLLHRATINYLSYKEIITSTGSVCLLASLFGGFFGIVISCFKKQQ